MNKKKSSIILFVLIFIASFCYSYFFLCLTNDEIWSYGFAYNIYRGLVPYRDFNMVITPMYSFVLSFFIHLFGNHLFAMHILNAFIVSFLSFYSIFKIGKKSIFIIPFFFFFGFPGYNFWSIFLFFFVLIFADYNKKNSEILLGFLISFLFLSKQTIGFCLFIPYIFYAKDKLRAIISFMIPICLFVCYLLWNNTFYQFIDYCFLGLFDFGKHNNTLSFLPFEIIVLFLLIYWLFKSNFNDKKAFYVLGFQIVVFPIVEFAHFFVGFIPFLYYILERFKFNFIYGYKFKYFLIMVICFFFHISYLFYYYEDSIFFSNSSSFLYGRVILDYVSDSVNKVSNYLVEVSDSYDHVFLFTAHCYFIKLNSGYVLNKYDLINNGNMGYKGDVKYIHEINDMCSNDSCLFFINSYEFGDGHHNQTNENILNYVYDNYDRMKEISNTGFVLYSNKKE